MRETENNETVKFKFERKIFKLEFYTQPNKGKDRIRCFQPFNTQSLTAMSLSQAATEGYILPK